MDIVEWLVESRLARLMIALIVLAISGVLFLAGVFWPWGWFIGGILLLTTIPGGRKTEGF